MKQPLFLVCACITAMEPHQPPARSSCNTSKSEERNMRGILLWAIGVPIPIIILIYFLF